MNRRDFTKLLGAGTAGAWTLGRWEFNSLAAAAPLSGPGYGHGVFLVSGKPVFPVAGSIDYFRCPPELWRDRLLKAKRGGLNCISSYIAWNFHEAEEGRFNFSGERDLGRFIDLCGELGLYFYARVGPFICGEWDGAGHPAWLIAKDDIQFRAMHEPTLKYVRRWFDHLIPIIARRQVSRGGPVILVQQENEYHFADRPAGGDYQATLGRWLRELSIVVTISDCNLSNARIPGSLQTINGFDLAKARRYQEERPGVPVMISEFYPGYLETWGQAPILAPAQPLLRQAMEMLSARVMYNYFMYHGGTNFGFKASSSWQTDDAFVTTSYFPYGPLAEGGAFNDTYFTAKAADQLALHFQDFFCASEPTEPPVESRGGIRVSALRSPLGTMLFTQPIQEDSVACGQLLLPSGEPLDLADNPTRPMMIPFAYEATPGCRIDWANASLMVVAGSTKRPVLVFRGDPGFKGKASVNGRVVEFNFGRPEPVVIKTGNFQLVALSHGLADRTWYAEGRLLIGPAYVGEQRGRKHEGWFLGGATPVEVFEADGREHRKAITAPAAPDRRITLSGWRAFGLPEIDGGGDHWRPFTPPQSLEQLGIYEGYAWYRASLHSDRARPSTLQFTQAGDRFHIFINGRPYGVWGRGARATRDPLPIELAAGDNDFVFLCDNMGHSSEGRGKQRKGILGPVVLDAAARELGTPRRFVPKAPRADNYEAKTYRAFHRDGTLTGLAWTVKPGAAERLLLTLREVAQYAWIRVNGRLVGEHGGDFSLVNGFSYNEYLLPADLGVGPVEIEVILYGISTARRGKSRRSMSSCSRTPISPALRSGVSSRGAIRASSRRRFRARQSGGNVPCRNLVCRGRYSSTSRG